MNVVAGKSVGGSRASLCHVLTLTVPHFVTQMKKARVVRKVVNQLKKAASKK